MKRILPFLLLSAALLLFSFKATFIEYETRSILDNKVEIKIPKGFGLMSDSDLKIKYPGNNRPSMVYSDETTQINLAFTHTKNEAGQDQLSDYMDVFVKSFKARNPVKWIGNGTRQVNGRNIGYIQIITQAVDTKIYNQIFFTDVDGRLLICSFNCTEKFMKDWQIAGDDIMNSLKVK